MIKPYRQLSIIVLSIYKYMLPLYITAFSLVMIAWIVLDDESVALSLKNCIRHWIFYQINTEKSQTVKIRYWIVILIRELMEHD